ncbi:MAG TPA: signal peptidase I [Acidimicrobiales bacterium]|jgi:signal peptidase I
MAPGTSDPSAGDGPLVVPQDGEHAGSGSLDTQVTEAETGEGAGEPAAGSHKKRRSGRSWLVELVVIVVVVLGASFLVRTFVVQTFYIPSGSMIPTLQVGDRILVDKLSYHLHGVGRGDIVVFSKPPLEQQNINDLVKRVIGLPGETISSVNGEIYINGKLLPEPWLQPGVKSLPGPNPVPFNLDKPYKIPAGEYYVMGDNRTDSEDSRWFGPIPRSLIVGRAFIRIWPLSRIGGL